MAIIVGTSSAEVLSGTASDDSITGLGGNDTIFGNDGNDTIDGGTGVDALIGGLGNDIFRVDDAADQVFESLNEGTDTVVASTNFILQQGTYVEQLTAATGTAPIYLGGNERAQLVTGNAGDNVLVGNSTTLAPLGGFDTLDGGLGNDTYLVRQTGDVVIEAANAGTDIVYSDVSYNLADGVEVEALSAVTQSNTTDLNFTGNGFNQTIVGNFGNNILSGGGGTDTLIGLKGNDLYVVSIASTVVAEAVGDGADTVLANVSYVLTSGAEVEVLSTQDTTASTAIDLRGNAFGQQILGNAGANELWGDNDTVAGNGGADTLTGFAGNDIYHVDSLDDVVIENAGGEGGTTDQVYSAGNYALGAGSAVEYLRGEGWIESALVFDGGFLVSSSLSTSTVDQYLVGNGLQVQIAGTNGANIIDPGAATAGTQLLGLGGNDIYRVYRQEDRVLEDDGEGTDIIYTSASYSLLVNDAAAGSYSASGRNEIEQLIAADATATTAINLTGNANNQFIVGNAGANILNSGGGVDTLIGLGGNDTYVVSNTGTVVTEGAGGGADIVFVAASVTSSYILTAGSEVEAMAAITQTATDAINITGNTLVQTITGNNGNNILNSGGGADTLIGLLGDDTYRVYGEGETIVEATGEGTDTVFTSATFTLATGVSVETISTANQSGTEAINLTGNAVSQTLIGNFGNNVLTGGGTTGDTLQGLLGDDTYVIKAGDTIIEAAGQGSDTARTADSYTLAAGVSIETLSVFDAASTTDVNLTGNELANTLVGNDGINILDGKLGNDTLVGGGRGDTFMFSTALNGTTNVDFIQDFASGDRIGLLTSIFAGTVATSPNGQLQANQFVVGTAALDANDFIVYNQATGQIFYDADGSGSGAAVLFATVAAGTVLAAADFAPITPA